MEENFPRETTAFSRSGREGFSPPSREMARVFCMELRIGEGLGEGQGDGGRQYLFEAVLY